MKTPTRDDYMTRRVTHAEYYRALAETAGISYVDGDPRLLNSVRRALAEGDEHLNTIPLHWWDIRAQCLYPTVRRAFQAHGDTDTLAGRVCLIKQAARDAVTDIATVEAPGQWYRRVHVPGHDPYYETVAKLVDGTMDLREVDNKPNWILVAMDMIDESAADEIRSLFNGMEVDQ